MSLTEQEILNFEKQLQQSLAEAETTLKHLDAELEFGDDIDHFEEEADETEEFANQLSIRKMLHDKINNIVLALSKIKENKYGICERCGQPIEITVLHAVPESRFCKKCKKTT